MCKFPLYIQHFNLVLPCTFRLNGSSANLMKKNALRRRSKQEILEDKRIKETEAKEIAQKMAQFNHMEQQVNQLREETRNMQAME